MTNQTKDDVSEMIINYVPGEECRIAITHGGRLEEYHAERADAESHVGSIYVGKVVNVEPAIQAAFIDFGLEHNGFLHVSDLHPKYFPGEGDETTEMVGKKTPRRERPPIQECLKRGQEIAVQVLKEGVGTKGPTLTSYLSIPGRFLVMMPQMDRVGVSRKVEDDEVRIKMRQILDQLELPDGFGFILRTAGLERTKAELKRDLAYLSRLWKDMEKRWAKGNKPRLLYSESDLLVRALRDVLTTDIERIVIDNEGALNRAARFLKIVSPRSATRLVHYKGRTPVFHAMGLDEQIQMIYAREVPLPSGGRLVIDETEALVAIDVNSGRMRNTRDAETTAYRTNLEATDEICRQIRLRDLGGVIVNDLIDMRPLKHRRDIEGRFKENLKRDRARSTLATISPFGILEMTRQRMRGSHESVHFAGCPVCRGRGLVQRPDSVVADAMRELAVLLEHERVARVEMVLAPRIAGEMLSGRRQALARLERTTGKHVDARVSEAAPVDRVTFYAYDSREADVDITKLPQIKAAPEDLVEFALTGMGQNENWADEPIEPEPLIDAEAERQERQLAEMIPLPGEEVAEEPGGAAEAGPSKPEADRGERTGKGRRRRRGRGRRDGARDGEAPATAEPAAEGTAVAKPLENGEARSAAAEGEAAGTDRDPEQVGKRRRRRRRGRGRRGDGPPADGSAPAHDAGSHVEGASPEPGAAMESASVPGEGAGASEPTDLASDGQDSDGRAGGPGQDPERRGRRRRRRRGRRGAGEGAAEGPAGNERGAPAQPADPGVAAAPPAERAGNGGAASNGQAAAEEGGERRGRRRRRKRGGRGRDGRPGDGGAGVADGPGGPPPSRPPAAPSGGGGSPSAGGGTPPKPKPRSLYGAARRRLGPGDRPSYDRE